MSYVQSVLVPGETVIVQARIHWFIYLDVLFWLLLGAALSLLLPLPFAILGYLLLAYGLFLAIKDWIHVASTELAVTSARVIAKFGFIRRETVELRHSKVESLQVNQSILGRIFNYGSVVITGSGGTHAPIPYISDPLKFRSLALTGMEATAGEPSAAHDPE
ncbi:MAG: PH domain-containing protein [Thermomonas sp.]|uniref:PH domain-containing protein n=1 Tax=Thermomonas sp. TaxID=1971895 RepID=UPI0026311BBE|nr:PH domain-containing protein [Thermomonas sp.]MCC7097094.1 PH domain-containing protein [Thermomonas sp.]